MNYYASDFRAMARDALYGKWSLAVGTGLIAAILGAALDGDTLVSAVIEQSRKYLLPDSGDNIWYLFSNWNSHFFYGVMAFISIIFAVLAIWGIICFIIGGATTLGYAKFNLNLVDGTEAQFQDIFSDFRRIGVGFAMQFLRGLFIFLWSLLFIIPGIIASYRYAMTPFILAENPDMKAREAIDISAQLMYGNKWRLFCLELSFIGWAILCIFTAGIGYLWLVPYISASKAAFYRKISHTSE